MSGRCSCMRTASCSRSVSLRRRRSPNVAGRDRGTTPAISARSQCRSWSQALSARAYHLFTGYDWSTGGLIGTVQIWRGGLSIWGAVLGGLLALVFVARRRHLDLVALMDAIAPAVLIGQAIGRFGNYFNQELFGRPTTLPWGLEIDLAHRPAGYTQYATFHPTFLYESLWCLLVFAIIVVPSAVSACARVRRSRCTSVCTRSAVPGLRRFGSTRRHACSASGSISWCQPCCVLVEPYGSCGSHDKPRAISVDQTMSRPLLQ